MVDKGTGNRLTIGLFITWIEDSYHLPIWKSIAEKAAEQDINLLIFVGDAPDSTILSGNPRTSIYDLANEELINGLIIITSSIGNFIPTEQLTKFCDKYRGIPVVTIGSAVEGIPAVLIDNKEGTYRLTKHLIEVHGCKRFAFFSGPSHNAENALRFQGFTDALKEHDILFNQDFIIEGDFAYKYHKEIEKILSYYKQLNFNAIVCANDYMAMNNILQFLSAGYKIPKDIAITGFDDIPAARHLNPPLTTVRQPVEELGEKAFTLLLAKILGKQVPDRIYLPTQFIIRQSCGCLSYSVNQAGRKVTPYKTQMKGKPVLSKAGIISNLVFNLKIPVQKREKTKRWLDDFFSCTEKYLKNENKINDVIYTFTDILPDLTDDTYNENYWQNFLNQIRDGVLSLFKTGEEQKKIRLIFKKLAIHLNELLMSTNTYKTLLFWEENNKLRLINYNISSSFDFTNLVQHIISDLPKLRITDCYIAEYEDKIYSLDKIRYFISRWSKLFLAFQNNRKVDLEEKDNKFFTSKLIPAYLVPAEQYIFFVLPLISNSTSFGYMLLRLCDCNPSTYISLQSTISSAMIGAYNVEELKATKELAESANNIRSQFLANMSHEIRTPLNFILGFTDLLLDEERNTDKKRTLETINRAGRNLLMIINDVLDYSKMEAGKIEFHYEKFSLRQFFHHIKNMFSLEAKKHNLNFLIEIDESIPQSAIGDEQRFTQIMINLLDNAFKFTEKGMVKLASRYKNEIITIIVTDTGIGIPKEKLCQLFSPFQQADSSTTRKYGGTGLGLAITHNLVEKMGGDIALSSVPGEGSTFIVKFPLQGCPEVNKQHSYPVSSDVEKKPAIIEEVIGEKAPEDYEKNLLNLNLNYRQWKELQQIIRRLKKFQKIFDEDLIKQEADNLLSVSEESAFQAMRNKLYKAAENYEIIMLSKLCQELENIGEKYEVLTRRKSHT